MNRGAGVKVTTRPLRVTSGAEDASPPVPRSAPDGLPGDALGGTRTDASAWRRAGRDVARFRRTDRKGGTV